MTDYSYVCDATCPCCNSTVRVMGSEGHTATCKNCGHQASVSEWCNLTTPDAGHAAETMSDEELIDRLIDAAVVAAQTREAIRWEHGAEAKADLQLAFNRERKTLERRKAEALRRMHTAPAEATARQSVASILRSLYPKQKTGQPELVADAWGRDADEFLAALAEAGLVIVRQRLLQHAKFDPKVLHREDLFDDALALQFVLAARQPEGDNGALKLVIQEAGA